LVSSSKKTNPLSPMSTKPAMSQAYNAQKKLFAQEQYSARHLRQPDAVPNVTRKLQCVDSRERVEEFLSTHDRTKKCAPRRSFPLSRPSLHQLPHKSPQKGVKSGGFERQNDVSTGLCGLSAEVSKMSLNRRRSDTRDSIEWTR
jgi:hypothetical protein